MIKKLNEEGISNELEGSGFFSKKPEQKASPKKPTANKTEDTVRAYGRPDDLLELLPPTPEKRRPERYAFQFWADQITRLKKLKQIIDIGKDAEDRNEIKLSDMVREAIDDYISKQISKFKQTARTDK